MDKPVAVLTIVIAILAVFLLGTAITSFVSMPAVEKETVNIGVIMPLSGIRADGGAYASNGLNLALGEINSDLGRKYKINLLFEDSEYKPDKAATAIQKLISVDGVKFAIGEMGSSQVLAMAPIAEKNRVILMNPWAQSTDLSSAGDYIFRTTITTEQEADFFAGFIAKRAKKIDFIGINTAYYKSYVASFTAAFEKLGGTVGLVEKLEQDATDAKTELTKLKLAGAKDILIVSVPKQSGMILKQARELGIEANFYGVSPLESKEMLQVAGNASNGLIYPLPYDIRDTQKSAVAYREKYLARYGEINEMLSANCYDSLYLLSNCFEEVGANTGAVKLCLYNTKNYDGASGKFSFDSNGDVKKDFIIKQVNDGKFVPFEE